MIKFIKYVLLILVLSLLSSCGCIEGTDAQIAVMEETCSEYKITAKYLNSSNIEVQCRCKSSGYIFESDIDCILGECRWAYGNKCGDGQKDTVKVYIKTEPKIEIQYDTIYINTKHDDNDDWLSDN
jgi:hypothetical protein